MRKDEAQAQQLVQACVTKGNFLTRPGRQAVIKCIAPPGQKVQFEQCATKALAKDGFLLPGQRRHLYQDLTVCLEKHR